MCSGRFRWFGHVQSRHTNSVGPGLVVIVRGSRRLVRPRKTVNNRSDRCVKACVLTRISPSVPDLQRSRCSICYGPRAFRGPALLLRFFYKNKTNLIIIFYLRMINHVNMIIFFTNKESHVRKITCVLQLLYMPILIGKCIIIIMRRLNVYVVYRVSEGNHCIEPHTTFR